MYINRLKYKKLCISDKNLKFSLNCPISSLLFTLDTMPKSKTIMRHRAISDSATISLLEAVTEIFVAEFAVESNGETMRFVTKAGADEERLGVAGEEN